MSRCVRPCDACGGVYYDGEPCRFCERLESARRWAAAWKAACKQYAWRFGVMHRTHRALLRQVEEIAYQRGQERMRERAAALVAALYDEFPGQHDYLKGGQLALDLAEQRIRALEVDAEEKPCRHVCIDCGLAFRPSARCRLCTKGHDRERLRKRRAICQCGSAAKDLACKMSCPGSEVEP